MVEKRLSMLINVSIIVILIIFTALLSLPLRLLLNTNYHEKGSVQNETSVSGGKDEKVQMNRVMKAINFRKLRLCPRLSYEDQTKSILFTNYDLNCTYRKAVKKMKEKKKKQNIVRFDLERKLENINLKIASEALVEFKDKIIRVTQSKCVPVAGNILATMLIVSALGALIEVLRIRFSKGKHQEISASRRRLPLRKAPTFDFSISKGFLTKEPVKSQRSLDFPKIQRSPVRLLEAKPPPLMRRSSFPTQHQPMKPNNPLTGTPPILRKSRRTSIESDEEIVSHGPGSHHRTRLIRRH